MNAPSCRHIASPTMVVKSFFIKGKTEPDGTFPVKISDRDCNIYVGSWRCCLSNLLIKLTNNTSGAPISVSTNLAFQHMDVNAIRDTFRDQTVPVRLSVISVNGWKDEIIPAINEGTSWVHFENPPTNVKLFFTNEATDTGYEAFIFGTLLLERIS